MPLVSTELDGLLGLAVRIAVAHHGRGVAALPAAQARRAASGLLMTGGRPEEDAAPIP